MSINQVRVEWSGTAVSGGGLTIFNFDAATGTAAQQVSAVTTFLTATNSMRVIGTQWATDPDIAELDETTGTLIGLSSVTSVAGNGTATGDMASIPTQALMRALTSTIVNGRLLRGRMFFPGAPESVNNGGPTAGIITAYDTAGAALVADANTLWSVWSRTHGVRASVVTVSTWNKWGVLRSRRD